MSLLTDLLERAARAVVPTPREERELEEELRFHLEMETEQNRQAGMSEAEARRRSRDGAGRRGAHQGGRARRPRHAAGGRRHAATSDTRSARWSHTPAFAIVAVLTLAIGIGGTTAVFSAVDAVLIRPLPYQQPGQLVRLYQCGTATRIPAASCRRWRISRSGRGFRHSMRRRRWTCISRSGADIGSGDAARSHSAASRERRLLRRHADAVPALGRALHRDEETGARSVVLSHGLWEAQFGGALAAIGRPFDMGGQPYTVVGVMPAGVRRPGRRRRRCVGSARSHARARREQYRQSLSGCRGAAPARCYAPTRRRPS